MDQTAVQNVAEKLAPVAVPVDIRRFEVPDVDRHGGWLLPRIAQAYPHLQERHLVGWLRGMVYNNEFLFLYQDHAVALAHSVRPDPFTPSIVIWERFVFAQDPKNHAHIEAAAQFYERFLAWGKHQDASTVVVGEHSDVPIEMIKTKFGRLFERKHIFAKV